MKFSLKLTPAELSTIVERQIKKMYPNSELRDGKFHISGVSPWRGGVAELSYSVEIDDGIDIVVAQEDENE